MKIIKNKKYLIISVIVLLGIFSLLLFSLFYAGNMKDKAEHYYLLGKAYESQGYFEKAKDSYENSVESKPDSIVYNALGNLYEYLGDNIEAIDAFQKGIKADKDDIETYFDLGRVYINLREYSKAEETLFLIIEKDNESASTYALLGTVYIETNKWSLAEDYLTKSLSLQERASTYNDLGVVYENMGNYGLAIESYEHALMIDFDFELARNNLERLQN